LQVGSKAQNVAAYNANIARGLTHEQACIEAGRERGVLPATIADCVKRLQNPLYQKAEAPAEQKPGQLSDLANQICVAIGTRKRTIEDLADLFSVPPKSVRAALDELRTHGIILETQGDALQIGKSLAPIEAPQKIDTARHGEIEIPIGLIADTHLCSRYARLDVLADIYDRFAANGIENVYHAGNWIDGEARFNTHDLDVHGAYRQVDFFVRNYPRHKNITTHILSGDDHEGWYTQRDGFNMGQILLATASEYGRDDFVDLGYMERDIELAQEEGSARLRIVHPGGGSAYAISYAPQKYVETLQGGEKPTIIIMGHYHKFGYDYPREVHVVQPGCVQDQTPFLRKRKIQAMVGGCIAWIKQSRAGIVTSFKIEWLPYYDRKFYAYKW
jgi:hypothetical protein